MAVGNITGAVGTAGLSSGGISAAPKSSGSGFADLVKGITNDAIDKSKAADQASVSAVNGEISDLDLANIMTEADISLQRFKSVYETSKQSLEKIINMQI